VTPVPARLLAPAQVVAIHIGLDPVAFQLGPIAIHWYGIMYVIAIFTGTMVAKRYIQTFGASEEALWDVFAWAIGAGLVGGRLYYVVQNRQSYYLMHPQHILAFWEGGMAFFGAVGAVLLTIVIYGWMRKVPILPILDVAAIFAAVGQPIGRIGNIVNGDIVGYPTSLPWGTVYTNPHSLAPEVGIAYQPAAAYEILANLFLIVVLWLVLRRRRPPGLASGVYLLGYSVTQFIVFFWRDNSITAIGLKQAQLTAIALALASVAYLAVLWWSNRNRDSVAATRPIMASLSEGR
jgi:phosphatidylglycerol:prolipoprotein diacylglycerol transferase